ncbi:MAG: nucleotidyltransferase family protein [Pseudomonadota bacterium]
MRWPVMLFAAGFGARMRHLTADRPKPMVEVGGRPLIDYAVDLARDLPAATVVANLHYKPDALQQHLTALDVQTILETPDILETGGGLRNALPRLGAKTVMTLNTDAVWGGSNPLKQLSEQWKPDRMDGLLMCIPPDRAVGYQRGGNFLIDPRGRITRGPGLIYGGAQIIKTDRLSEIQTQVFSLNVLWDMLIAENSLYSAVYDGDWCDVGHPEGIPLAEAVIEGRNV